MYWAILKYKIMKKLNYYFGSTPKDVNDFVNGQNYEVVSITFDGIYYVVFYYLP